MKADFHVHSCFSGDSDAPLEEQVKKALTEGLDALCFTDHYDADYPYTDTDFHLDTIPYLEAVSNLKQNYGNQISLYTGVELGLQPHLGAFYADYCRQFPFDFVIGSTHLVNGQDPYYASFWEGNSSRSCLESFFQVTRENIRSHDCFDVYGHLDYMIRYIPEGNPHFSYFDYMDLIDECLRLLLEKGKGLEVNTGGYKAGLGAPNPGRDILKRYRELGGEIITTGSDAHFPQYVGYRFDLAYALIQECGFRYLAVFQQRQAKFFPI